ncbi:MAG: gliding motility-associated C-terminal domain-containing protein [Saprospiraceae bacterium]|nr:gliding motility-associated C-terminal domain-containing protein [Saprospiraceae bacterium]
MALFSSSSMAQQAEEVQLISSFDRSIPCDQNSIIDAGTIASIRAFNAESNQAESFPPFDDTIFLCYGDLIFIDHEQDQQFDALPRTSGGGVGYAYYREKPVVRGFAEQDLVRDGIEPNPAGNAESPFFVARGQPNGDAYFQNLGQVQDQFFNGAPGQMWFAPITLSQFDSLKVNDQCVVISPGSAFSIVYLNEIVLSSLQTPAGSTSGTLSVTGGLPEWKAGASYSISMVNTADPSLVGQVNEIATHDGTVTFDVPEPGNYEVTVTDGMGCSFSTIRRIPADVDPVVLCMGDSIVDAGSQFCVPIRVRDYEEILSFSFSILWDPTVLTLENFANPHPSISGSASLVLDRAAEGRFTTLWFDQGLTPQTLADNEILFELCFTAIGTPGDRTGLTFAPTLTSDLTITNEVTDVPFETKHGSISLTPPLIVDVFDATACRVGGSIEVSFTTYGGRGPYQFEVIDLNSGTFVSQGTITSPGEIIRLTNVTASSIQINVRDDAGGNGGTAPIDLSMINQVSFDLATDDLSCVGSSDGIIKVENLVSNGPATFQWRNLDTDLVLYGVDSLGEQDPGRWELTVTDANGCVATERDSILGGGVELMTAQIRALPTCNGADDGELFWTTTVPGAFQYRWFDAEANPIGNAVTSSNGSSKPNLAPGQYFIEVTDMAGTCPALRDSFTLIADKNIMLAPSTSNDENVSCAGRTDAQVQFTASADQNDSQNYTFRWSGLGSGIQADDPTSTTVTGLSPGTYRVTATEVATGCIQSDTITITDPRPLNVSAAVMQPSCPDGIDGEIDFGFFNDIGGTPLSSWPPYTIDWNGIQRADRSSTGPFLPAGAYTVALTDANGCQDSTVFVLRSGPTIEIDDALVDLTCIGDMDATLSVMGEIGGNEILWSTGEQTPMISGLGAGTYAVTVTETINGMVCPAIDSFEIMDPVFPVSIGRDMRFDALSGCSETPSGRIFNMQINIGGPKDWQWNGPTFDTLITENEPFLRVAEPGLYRYSVLNVDDCIVYQDSISVSFPEPIDVDTTLLSNQSCHRVADGAIQLAVSRPSTGSDQFSFTWSTGDTDFGATTSIVNGLDSGMYTVEIVDLLDPACVAQLEIPIDDPPPLTLRLDSMASRLNLCFGDQDGAIELIWEGGNRDAAPIISWSHDSAVPGLLATDLGARQYEIQLSDSRGCADTALVEITELTEILTIYDQPIEPNCHGGATSIAVTDASGGLPGYSFSIDNGPTQTLGTDIPIFAGEHIVTVFDAAGCRRDDTIMVNQPEEILVNLGGEITVGLGESVRLDPDLSGIDQVDSFLWNPGELLTCSNCANPMAFPIDDQQFILQVVDLNGCSATGEVMVRVDKARNLFIPNAFTPDNDGINDKWQIFTGPSVRQIKWTQVFDRWGNLVYEHGEEPPNGLGTEGWDGRMGADMMDPGVYMYLVQVDFVDGKSFLFRGDINLVR